MVQDNDDEKVVVDDVVIRSETNNNEVAHPVVTNKNQNQNDATPTEHQKTSTIIEERNDNNHAENNNTHDNNNKDKQDPKIVPPTVSSSNEQKKNNTNTNNDRLFSLRVKSEFIVSERPDSLGPLGPNPNGGGGGGDGDDNADEEDDPNQRQSGKQRKKKKKKGMNKKRPRDVRQDDSEKVCLAILKGEKECPYGDHCRFSHDLKAYMATRPTDIQEVEGGCPNFKTFGYCIYGAMCRFGSCHITKTGENVKKEIPSVGKEDSKEKEDAAQSSSLLLDGATSLLPRDVQAQLRKKTFPFKCKRHFEKSDKSEKVVANATANAQDDTKMSTEPEIASTSSTTPVELTKTRKIIDFSNKIYVAPLTTVGNLPFRRIMKKFGADITCGEMALATGLLEGKPSEWALLKRHPEEDVFGIQIAAAHPDQFTRVSELIDQYASADFVDLNLGCPLDLVCSKGAGAGLMMRDRKLKGALEGITSTITSYPITLKMRTGWDIHKPFAHLLVPKIQSWGIDGIGAIMVHGRSRLQRYQKLADWEYISEIAKSQSDDYPKIPIIGNGDIFSFTDYEEKMKYDGVSKTAMLARGALIKPWLPTEIKERRHWDISASERLDILKDFVRFGLEHWGSDQQGVNNTRRFLLEWLSFLHRYVPVGLLEVVPQQMNQRPPVYMLGRSDLETLFLSSQCNDWIKISEMLLGPVHEGFQFQPKHKANGYEY